jgi:hypothetical protein
VSNPRVLYLLSMRIILSVLALSLIGCFPPDDVDTTPTPPDAGQPAPDACPHTQEGCAGCGLEGRSCCQRSDQDVRAGLGDRFYCIGENLMCDMVAQDCFTYNEPEPEPEGITGRELAYRLYNSMCEHERVCGRGDGKCGEEFTVQFCAAHDCDASLNVDRDALYACADLATTWQCEDQTANAPDCVLEFLAMVP